MPRNMATLLPQRLKSCRTVSRIDASGRHLRNCTSHVTLVYCIPPSTRWNRPLRFGWGWRLKAQLIFAIVPYLATLLISIGAVTLSVLPYKCIFDQLHLDGEHPSVRMAQRQPRSLVHPGHTIAPISPLHNVARNSVRIIAVMRRKVWNLAPKPGAFRTACQEPWTLRALPLASPSPLMKHSG